MRVLTVSKSKNESKYEEQSIMNEWYYLFLSTLINFILKNIYI